MRLDQAYEQWQLRATPMVIIVARAKTVRSNSNALPYGRGTRKIPIWRPKGRLGCALLRTTPRYARTTNGALLAMAILASQLRETAFVGGLRPGLAGARWWKPNAKSWARYGKSEKQKGNLVRERNIGKRGCTCQFRKFRGAVGAGRLAGRSEALRW